MARSSAIFIQILHGAFQRGGQSHNAGWDFRFRHGGFAPGHRRP